VPQDRAPGEDLSDEERVLIGFSTNGYKPADSCRSPSGLVHYYGDDGYHEDRLFAEDSALLSARMNVPRPDQLEFVNPDWSRSFCRHRAASYRCRWYSRAYVRVSKTLKATSENAVARDSARTRENVSGRPATSPA
jgi:hypothetical protein